MGSLFGPQAAIVGMACHKTFTFRFLYFMSFGCMEQTIPKRLSTLGHPQHLALFRLSVRRHGAMRNRLIGFAAFPATSLDRNSLQRVVGENGQPDEEGPSK